MKDGRAANIAAVGAAAIIAQQTAAKVTRDTLFLSSHDAAALPQAMLLAAGLALLAVLLLSRLQSDRGPGRVVPALALASGALFGVEALAQLWARPLTAYVVYVHVAVAGAATISGFWSVINERFDPHAARRCIGRIAFGATSGGVAGGLVADRVATYLGTNYLLGLLAVLSVACAILVAAIAPRHHDTAVSPRRSGLEVLRTSPFLRRIGGVVLLLAFSAALADFALKAKADATMSTPDQFASFFSLYYASVGALTLLAQTILTRRLLERFGVGATLAILPTVFISLGCAAMLAARLAVVVLLRGAASVVESSLHRSGYELLYTPVATADKRATKMLIDVAGVRIGDALGSGVVLLLVPLTDPARTLSLAIGLAVLAAAAALALVRRMGRDYVAQLAQTLTDGSSRNGTLLTDKSSSSDLGSLAQTGIADEDTLRLALWTVRCADDDCRRGAALEYLHNVLPARVRTTLWPRLSLPQTRADDAR